MFVRFFSYSGVPVWTVTSSTDASWSNPCEVVQCAPITFTEGMIGVGSADAPGCTNGGSGTKCTADCILQTYPRDQATCKAGCDVGYIQQEVELDCDTDRRTQGSDVLNIFTCQSASSTCTGEGTKVVGVTCTCDSGYSGEPEFVLSSWINTCDVNNCSQYQFGEGVIGGNNTDGVSSCVNQIVLATHAGDVGRTTKCNVKVQVLPDTISDT